jgi:hypothetical protein
MSDERDMRPSGRVKAAEFQDVAILIHRMTGSKTKIFKRMDTERTALKTGDLDSVNEFHRDQCLVSCDEIQNKRAGGIYVRSSASSSGTTGSSGGHGTMEFMIVIGDDASCTRINMEERKVGGVINSMRSKASN